MSSAALVSPGGRCFVKRNLLLRNRINLEQPPPREASNKRRVEPQIAVKRNGRDFYPRGVTKSYLSRFRPLCVLQLSLIREQRIGSKCSNLWLEIFLYILHFFPFFSFHSLWFSVYCLIQHATWWKRFRGAAMKFRGLLFFLKTGREREKEEKKEPRGEREREREKRGRMGARGGKEDRG